MYFDINDYLISTKTNESKERLQKMFENWLKDMLGRFQIRKIPRRYRPYVKNFLDFKDKYQKNAIENINGEDVLLHDDVFDTGSTLQEIVYQIQDCVDIRNIYIFTLLDDRKMRELNIR